MMVRAASTTIFNALARCGCQLMPLYELAEHPQYGFTTSAMFENAGPKFVRITDLQNGKIEWDNVPYCKCDEPENYLLKEDDILFARTGATTGKTHLSSQ
jgi:type I restriction enzyme, S subunit